MHERSTSRSGSAHTIDRRSLLKLTTAAAVGAIATRSLRKAEAAPEPGPYPAAGPVTSGPKHHFFGYYDKCPWDATGQFLLAMEIGFYDRQPRPGEPLTVGMVDLKDGNRYIPLDTTFAWCWQQGTMLQWLGTAPQREVIYNSVSDQRYVSIIRDVHSGRTRTLGQPIYAISLGLRRYLSGRTGHANADALPSGGQYAPRHRTVLHTPQASPSILPLRLTPALEPRRDPGVHRLGPQAHEASLYHRRKSYHKAGIEQVKR